MSPYYTLILKLINLKVSLIIGVQFQSPPLGGRMAGVTCPGLGSWPPMDPMEQSTMGPDSWPSQ